MTDKSSSPAAPHEPLDVLFAILHLGTGGAERRCLLLAGALAAQGWRVGIVTLKPWHEQVAPVDPRVRLFMVNVSVGNVAGWVRLYRVLRQLRPTIYQGFGTLPGFPGTVVARLAGVPVVISALGTSTAAFPKWLAPFGWACFLFAHHAIANSHGVQDHFVRYWKFPQRKITVIPNPIETAVWPCRDDELRRQTRAELGLSDEQVVIGVVARLFDYKGHTHLFDAFAQVAAEHPRAVLVLVGEGPLLDELTAQAQSLGLAERIHFLGLRHDVPRLLQAFDLFCLPSLLEGMPNVVLEAMAAGLAVISTTVPGATELVVPGETGWLVAIADSDAIARALREALGDRNRLQAYGQAGRRRVEQNFDLPVIIDRCLAFYEQAAPGTLGRHS